jgi:predicted RNA-binding Zn-ribbon protein involved in translation (DUF1610 family)
MGVELKLNSPIGGKLSLNELHDKGYDAIFLAIGAHDGVDLNVEGENLKGVHRAVDFLRKVNLGERVAKERLPIGKKCPNCGSTNLKRYQDKDVNYIYCEDCDSEIQLSELYKRLKPEYECDKCGTAVS